MTSQWGRRHVSNICLAFSGYLICSPAGPARHASPIRHIQPSGALGRLIFSYFLEASPQSGWSSQAGQPSPASPTERHFEKINFPHRDKALPPVRPAQPGQPAQSDPASPVARCNVSSSSLDETQPTPKSERQVCRQEKPQFGVV